MTGRQCVKYVEVQTSGGFISNIPFQHVSTTRAHLIGVQFQGKSWEPVKGVPVDREGEFVYGLRPSVDKVMDRLLCEITVKDNVKVITLRSTYNVENLTSYTMELVLVDSYNKPAYSVQKIGGYSSLLEIVASPDSDTLRRTRWTILSSDRGRHQKSY
jgi:hypothetical protein